MSAYLGNGGIYEARNNPASAYLGVQNRGARCTGVSRAGGRAGRQARDTRSGYATPHGWRVVVGKGASARCDVLQSSTLRGANLLEAMFSAAAELQYVPQPHARLSVSPAPAPYVGT